MKLSRTLTKTFVGMRIAEAVIRTVVVLNALHLEASKTLIERISQMPGRTSTGQGMIGHGAQSIHPAFVAGVLALAPFAHQLIRTVAIRPTLSRPSAAGAGIGISYHPFGTDALVGPQIVFADGTAMAWVGFAFVDIAAALRGPNESSAAFAGPFQAGLRRIAVTIPSTPRLADFIPANFPGEAVAVSEANLEAAFVCTAFACSAIIVPFAGESALVVEARVSLWALMLGVA